MLQVGFYGQSAKMKDGRRDFEQAAWDFYRVSNMDLGAEGQGVDMGEMFLKPAMLCAILTPSGDKKIALMSTLYKDERS